VRFPRVSKKHKQEVVNGFRLAGGVLLGMALMGGLVVCTGVAFGTVESSRLSRPVGFAIAVASLALIALMVQWWAKYFPGFVAYSLFNALLMASSGHLVNDPSVPVARWLVLSLGVLSAISALVSVRFTKHYKLKLLDKIALLTWVLAFTLAANAERFGLAAMVIGCVALVIAWCYHRATIRHQAAQTHGSQPHTPS